MQRIRVAQVGLGPIGQACVKLLSTKPAVDLVGGVDIDPGMTGKDLGEVCGLPERLGIPVRGDLAAALADSRPQVVLHTTLSFLDKVEEQLATIVRAGASVISATEELFYPFPRSPGFSERLDALAREHGVAVVGTGVNPGFAMDLLPLFLTAVCTDVERITVRRVVDAGRRRLPFQRKVGAGLPRDEVEKSLAAGTFGHIGLRESALATMASLGWPADKIDEKIELVIAERRVTTDHLTVEPGRVAGLHQVMRVTSVGQERLVLDLSMYVGADDPQDSVEIEGSRPLRMRIDGGIFGDTATVAALVNAIPKIITAKPGLRTMMELPVPSAFLGG